MPGWASLLPTASIMPVTPPTSLVPMPLPPMQAGPEVTVNGNGAVDVTAEWPGSRYIRLGKKALKAYRAWQEAPVHPRFDITEVAQADDTEVAKLVAQYGAIPADSDLGQLAVDAGAKTYRQRIRFSDGSYATVEAIKLGGAGRKRMKRRNLTTNRLQTAAWVMRKLHAQQRLGKRLAAQAKKLYPTHHARPCAPKRRR